MGAISGQKPLPEAAARNAKICQLQLRGNTRKHWVGTPPMTESENQSVVAHVFHSRIARFWLRELPYIIVLALTIFGVAYTSVSHQPLVGYWQFLAVAVGLVCVATGWLHIHDPKARFRMVWTQALQWLAFLVAMNIVLLTNVQLTLTATATGLTLPPPLCGLRHAD
jgi:hypothetical protein